MKNFNLNIAINARGLVNRKDFSLLIWQKNAFNQSKQERNLNTFCHLTNLIIVGK